MPQPDRPLACAACGGALVRLDRLVWFDRGALGWARDAIGEVIGEVPWARALVEQVWDDQPVA